MKNGSDTQFGITVMKSETKITLHDETASFIGEQLFNMKHAMENQSA